MCRDINWRIFTLTPSSRLELPQTHFPTLSRLKTKDIAEVLNGYELLGKTAVLKNKAFVVVIAAAAAVVILRNRGKFCFCFLILNANC